MARFELEQVNTFWFMTLGVTAVSAGLLVYVLLLESALGAFSIREFYPVLSEESRTPRIALLDSDYTREINPFGIADTNAVWIDDLMQSWFAFLQNQDRSLPYSLINDAHLEAGALQAFDVLILPAALAMSDRQIESVQAFMEGGGSVLASWLPGYYRPDGTVRGVEFLESVFGVAFEAFVDRDDSNYRVDYATLPGTVRPGLYRRLQDGRIQAAPANAGAPPDSGSAFPALRGYRWADSLSAPAPPADFALADTATLPIRGLDGQLRNQAAVQVTYYAWVGDDPARMMPFPHTVVGMERFTMRGNTPLNVGLPPGFSTSIQVFDPAVRVRVVTSRATPAGYWSDLRDRESSSALPTNVGAVYGTYGQGRFVYLAFRRDAVGVGAMDQEELVSIDRFFMNVLSYLRRQPLFWKRPWPYPYMAGAVLQGVGDADVAHFEAIADSLDRLGMPATYFVRPEQADLHRLLAQRLYETGDIGVLGPPPRPGETLAERTDRLAGLRQALEQVVEGPVTAYRPSEPGRIDPDTRTALAQAGYRIVYPDSIGRRAVPEILPHPWAALTSVPMTVRSDRVIFAQLPDGTAERRQAVLLDDMNLARYDSGLYTLVFSSDRLAAPLYRDDLFMVANRLREQNFWVASSRELAEWWRVQRGVNLNVEAQSRSRLVLHVSNQNGEVARDIGVVIDLGWAVDFVRIRRELIGSPMPRYALLGDRTRLLLAVDELKPQETRLFHIDLMGGELEGQDHVRIAD